MRSLALWSRPSSGLGPAPRRTAKDRRQQEVDQAQSGHDAQHDQQLSQDLWQPGPELVEEWAVIGGGRYIGSGGGDDVGQVWTEYECGIEGEAGRDAVALQQPVASGVAG